MHFQLFRLSHIVINDLFQCAHLREPNNSNEFLDKLLKGLNVFSTDQLNAIK